MSDTGTLVYLPGQSAGGDAPIDWMDHTGKTTPLRAAAANWSNPRFSPDGRRLALDIGGGTGLDVWVYEWARDTLTRLTFDPGADRNPVWTPDGRRIVFASARGDKSTPNLYWQRADGTGDVQRLTESKNLQYPASWHPSGKFLAFEENVPQTGRDLLMLPMEGDEASGWKPGKPTVFLNSPANEREPMFSPDGRWLAYESNESGRFEVYVRPFPGPGGKWQISTSGGANADLVSRAARTVFRNARPAPHGRVVCGGRRLVPRRQAAPLVGQALRAGDKETTEASICIQTVNGSRSRQSRRRRPPPCRTRSCSSSTSSTSCAASRR